MTKDERRLEKHRKYNMSPKGQARYEKYEKAHPERAKRWGPVMELRARNKNYDALSS